MKRLAPSLQCVAVLILLVGCGGGGGGGGGDSPAAFVAYLRAVGGTGSDAAFSVSSLPDGGSLVTGRYMATATFGVGEPNGTALGTAGITDIFVARYQPDGMLAWARRAGGPGLDGGQGVAAFDDGSCIVTGYYQNTAVFGPGEPGVTSLTDVDGLGELFVARYHANGDLDWAVRAGRNFDDRANAVAVFSDGSCVVTGFFDTIAIFGQGDPQMTTLNGGTQDMFIARYNADGTLAWAKGAGGTGQDVGTDVAAYADGSCVVAGYFQGAATFAAGEPEVTVLTSAGLLDMFVARYTASGTLMWARRAGGASFDEGFGVASLPDGSCVVTGFFRGISYFGPGEPGQVVLVSIDDSNDAFVAKYTPGGALAWVRATGGSQTDTADSVALMPDGGFAVTGRYRGVAVFNRDAPGETFHVAEGDADAFLIRYDANGSLLWARTAGSWDRDFGHGVCAHPDGSLTMCGEFEETILFSADEPWTRSRVSVGGTDLFVARYNPDGTL